jgi:hypothetical protein
MRPIDDKKMLPKLSRNTLPVASPGPPPGGLSVFLSFAAASVALALAAASTGVAGTADMLRSNMECRGEALGVPPAALLRCNKRRESCFADRVPFIMVSFQDRVTWPAFLQYYSL